MSHSYFQEANVRLLTGSRFATQLRSRGVFARARGVRGARTRRNHHHHHHHHHHGQGAISSTVNLRRQEGINVFTVKGFSASEQPGTTFRSWPERLSRSRSCLVRRKAHMMKFKPNQTRTYDGEGFKKRAACLCFKNDREDEVLLVSSSRHPDQWIVPGGGMEPEEEPGGAAVREVYEEAGVRGTLGRLLGVFENQDSKHRTYVYVLTVTETLEDWEDSVNIGRKRKWFKIDEAIRVLQCHKPVHAEYLRKLSPCSSPTNGNSQGPGGLDDNASIRQTSSDCGLTRVHR